MSKEYHDSTYIQHERKALHLKHCNCSIVFVALTERYSKTNCTASRYIPKLHAIYKFWGIMMGALILPH